MNQEEQFAKAIVRQLDEHTERLSPEVKNRLAEARLQAVAALASRSGGHVQIGGGLMALLPVHLQQSPRLLSLMALLVAVLFAFVVTQQLTGHGHAEHGDAFLLASELPPEAYLDQGFYSWLEQQ